MGQSVTMEPSAANAAGSASFAASQSRSTADGRSDDDFAAHLQQADAGRDGSTDRSETNRSETNRSETNRSEANRSEANRSATERDRSATADGRPVRSTRDARPQDKTESHHAGDHADASGPTGDDSTASATTGPSSGVDPASTAAALAAGLPVGLATGGATSLGAQAGSPSASALTATSADAAATLGPADSPASTAATDPTGGIPGIAATAAAATTAAGPAAADRPTTGPAAATAATAAQVAGLRLGSASRGARPGDVLPAKARERTVQNYPLDPAVGAAGSAGTATDLAAALVTAVGAASVGGDAGQNPVVPTVSAITGPAAVAVGTAQADGLAAPDPAQSSVAGQLAASLQSLRDRADGVHVLTVRLHPDELGPVRVVARLTGSDVQLRVTTSTIAAAAAVTEAGPRLHDALAQAGLTSTGVSVDHDAGLGQQSGQPPNPQTQAGAHGFGHRGSGAPTGTATGPTDHRGPTGPTGSAVIPRSRHPQARTLDLQV
jgi:flagellar hook-length control protein FliK